jgi:hypothetical protein
MATTIDVTLPKLTVHADTVTLTVDRLREFVSSAVSDSSLQILIDAAFDAIDECIGPPGNVSEFFSVTGDLILLSKRAETIVTVREDAASWTPLTLATDDYELRPSGRTLVRSQTGTNPGWFWGGPRWTGRVDVTYTPFDDTANRVRVALELVKLSIAFTPGLASQRIGEWAESYTAPSAGSYSEQREDILASLTHEGVV